MTDLESLKAELDRQDRGFDACFEQMRNLDPELTFGVSEESLAELEATTKPDVIEPPINWALRA